MKSLFTLMVCLLTVLTLSAQTKITKSGVVGKWVIASVEMSGVFFYDTEKDSLALGDMMKSQAKDEQQLTAMTNMMKPQLAMMSKMSFLFNADGTAEMGTPMAAAEPATYTVDEENSTITTTDKEKKQDTLKADMLKEHLRIIMEQPQGNMTMVLKKVKA
ncbi:MAG: hypothetical protein KGO92_06310 [Bacteroidota bacterium]|nr:hypothetical protein [Bacteroidota bacterium]